MKKIEFLFVIVFLVSGCSFNVEVVTPPPLQSDLPSITQSVASAMPVATVPVTTVTPYPGYTPVTSDPVFFGAYVALEQADELGQTRFAAGIKQIFALWHYQNMHADLTIKREWYLDGQLWLTREEPWDFVKYGEAGVLRDVSIYDLDVGLPSGDYKLMVYINDQAQPIGRRIIEGTAHGFIEFKILPVIESTSPDGQWRATSLVQNLVLTDANGTESDLFTGREVVSVAWLDNQHLMFIDRDRSNQILDLSVGIRDDLWIADIASQDVQALYKSETILGGAGKLIVSPDGRYVASFEGSGFGDACLVDTRLIFFEVATDYQSVKPIKQEQFAGLPVVPDGVVFPTDMGTWETNDRFVVPLSITCTTDESLAGSYAFDIPKLTATKK